MAEQNMEATQEQPPAGVPEEGGTAKTDGGIFGGPMMIIIIVLLWIWVLYSGRKQKKKAKERKEQIETIKKGDKIVTIGRLHGVVTALAEDTITVRIDEKTGTTMTFDRVAIHQVNPEKSEDTSDKA